MNPEQYVDLWSLATYKRCISFVLFLLCYTHHPETLDIEGIIMDEVRARELTDSSSFDRTKVYLERGSTFCMALHPRDCMSIIFQLSLYHHLYQHKGKHDYILVSCNPAFFFLSIPALKSVITHKFSQTTQSLQVNQSQRCGFSISADQSVLSYIKFNYQGLVAKTLKLKKINSPHSWYALVDFQV